MYYSFCILTISLLRYMMWMRSLVPHSVTLLPLQVTSGTRQAPPPTTNREEKYNQNDEDEEEKTSKTTACLTNNGWNMYRVCEQRRSLYRSLVVYVHGTEQKISWSVHTRYYYEACAKATANRSRQNGTKMMEALNAMHTYTLHSISSWTQTTHKMTYNGIRNIIIIMACVGRKVRAKSNENWRNK